jgi:hypothetical protein
VFTGLGVVASYFLAGTDSQVFDLFHCAEAISLRRLPSSRNAAVRHRDALWRIALVRMRYHPPTRAYVERRTEQGLSKLDIMRCFIG